MNSRIRSVCQYVPLLFALGLVATTHTSAAAPPTELTVATDFPGGSARVESIDQATQTVSIAPGGDEERGWVCWWHFKLTGIEPGETITLVVTGSGMALPDQAFYSLDGRQWQQTEPGKKRRGKIVYRQRVDAREAHFAWGPPFVLSDAQTLVADACRRNSHAESFTLCKSQGGRPVPALRVTQPKTSGQVRPVLWIQARQHAWESGSSWVCRGFVDWLLSSEPRAESFRSLVDVTIVPIMDVDNVETGNGGKNQQPHDHNRDWSDAPIWPEVAAAMQELRAIESAGRLAGFIDLHNPAWGDREPFFFVPPAEILSNAGRGKLERFLAAAGAEINGPLNLASQPRVSGSDYHPLWQQISKNWLVRQAEGNALAVTLETAWNTPHSTPDGYRLVGRQLGLALERWLKQSTDTR